MESLPALAVKHLPKNILRQSDKQSSNSEELLDSVKLAENFVHSLPAVALKNLAKNAPSPSDEQSSSSGECLDDVKLASKNQAPPLSDNSNTYPRSQHSVYPLLFLYTQCFLTTDADVAMQISLCL